MNVANIETRIDPKYRLQTAGTLEKRIESQAVTIVELLDERDNWRMVARLSQTLMVICVVGMIWMGYLVLVNR